MLTNKGIFKLIAGFFIFISCSSSKQTIQVEKMTTEKTAKVTANEASDPGLLESLLNKYPQYFAEILKNREKLHVQIIYTQVNRRANGAPDFENHYFNLNPDQYFYPASTVKLPIVLLALQKLQELKDKGIDMNTTMITETAFSRQTSVFNDPTSIDGRPTIGQYIKKILMVSDNDAYNRLYEFLGQEYINTELIKKGFSSAQILHRLNIFLTEAENRNTNPVKFYDAAGKLLYEQPGQNNQDQYALRKDTMGNAYYAGGNLVNSPMNFSKKNRLVLEDLHNIVLRTVFPEKVKAKERFNITADDRRFVLKYMSQYPTESLYPPYAADTSNYWATYCKFLYYGAEKVEPDKNIRIFNKPGDAYGNMIDAAYIVDHKNNIEFFLSAVIYCNSDGILNDDQYDYNTLGFPFMKNLGRVIYDHELNRKYKIKPDLSPFLFTYDK